MNKKYCESQFDYKRIPTREVKLGDLGIGGNNPIRVQSMTTTDTMDTLATIDQSIRMVESGAEIVRITAPSIKEAKNLQLIKDGLKKRGCEVPLVADIHFTPNAAEVAARIVEKVRVNPGNYVDKKKFNIIEYTDRQYEEEIERIAKRFSPLVKICKEYGTAMRIGTNHGSLSDRILSRYGDTPLGMVESALEFLRICESLGYYDIVISMKASNPQVMVQAYRLLMAKSYERGKMYPLHLGVTEAGEGEAGRIKSALGIGTLLMDGIGDTVRVSLTEEPEFESPVAKFIIDFFGNAKTSLSEPPEDFMEFNPYQYIRRETRPIENIGGDQVPRIICESSENNISDDFLKEVGYTYLPALDKFGIGDTAADFVFNSGSPFPGNFPGGLRKIIPSGLWSKTQRDDFYPFFDSGKEYLEAENKHQSLNFVKILSSTQIKDFSNNEKIVWVIEDNGSRSSMWEWRAISNQLLKLKSTHPLIFKVNVLNDFSFYNDENLMAKYRLDFLSMKQLYLSTLLSSFAVDGLIDGIWIDKTSAGQCSAAFGVLQAGRLRITKTEYISCPSCGRTLFDLQETTARIRKKTEHLKGVKIGIMGCIVNGPGEMADADFGYVGVGIGKIALYKGQKVVEKGVKTEDAVEKLIDLIKDNGRWVDP